MSSRIVPIAYFSVNCTLDKPDTLNNVRVVLSHTSHPGNIGAAARAMKTMGLQSLYLINPRRFPDQQADAMAANAADVLQNAVVCGSLDEALQGAVLVAGMSARVRDISQEVLTPRAAMPQMVQQATQQPVALLFGTEISGLTNDELARCHFMVRIPVSPSYTSLNLAAAVQLICYELRLATEQEEYAPPELSPAPAEQVERYFRHLEDTLIEIGFLREKQSTKLMQKLRRLYARARLEHEEVNILRGILTVTTEYHTQQKLDHQKKKLSE
ncbi:tRNA Cm32/Um32 methyltransferase [Candidatus Nitrotoga sp. BS]|uniref:RNA methyltransferase n=1 Tax=Candidatus Nitrotoga sp. BS TaxID=2890408 RepID=UPI001EF32E4E|nr:RNA methyltransferase [Candidatus Nitrotoga sp. BS]CAH1204693.1 tRNA Cm32/Um32 methyltransferase [Candidatus Nitrotoga sp. BS]